MSRSISLDIHIANNKPLCAKDIVKIFIDIGWVPFGRGGDVSYLPVKDNDQFNWKTEKIALDMLFAVIEEKEAHNEIIDIVLWHKDSNAGATMLIHEPNKISLSLDVNRRYINTERQTLDFNWYAVTIIEKMQEQNLHVDYHFGFII